MISNKFESYLSWTNKQDIINENITSKQNKHMTHAEDLVILGGEDGMHWVLSMFTLLFDKLKGNTESNDIRFSIKMDGAPSIFAWTYFNEQLDRPGVAIKSLFAKNPKIMFSDEEIDEYYSNRPDLANKLKYMLKYVSVLEIPNKEIWQGDFLFDRDSIMKDDINYMFHPNTIVYKVPIDSKLGNKIEQSDIGVVWHTRYTGDDLESITANYNTKIEELNECPEVFMIDPYIASLAGYVTFTDDETEDVDSRLEHIKINAEQLQEDNCYLDIINNKIFTSLFSIFQNNIIRMNIKDRNPDNTIDMFMEFLNMRYNKELLDRKSDKGKQTVHNKYNSLFELIDNCKETLIIIIDQIQSITDLKKIFMKKLNRLGHFQTLLKTKGGEMLDTGQEGFAISDIDGNIVKLVDRYEFSYANFSENILKGWQN